MQTRIPFYAAGTVLTILYVRIGLWGSGLVSAYPASLAVILAAGAVYLGACLLATRLPQEHRRTALWFTVVTAAIAYAAQIPAIPSLSDDIFRYLWDGHVQAHGINPFRFPPDAPELAQLRTVWHPLINHPSVSTIYPPSAQILFLIASAVWHHPASVKILLVGCVGVTGWFVAGLLERRGEPVTRVAWLLWNPLIVVEIANSGHVDILAALFVVMAVAMWEQDRTGWAWAALALGTMAKLYPAFLAPVFLLRRPRDWRGPAIFVAVCVVTILPYVGAGERLFVGLGAFSGGWRFNESLFGLIAAVMPDRAFAEWATPFLVERFRRFGLTYVPDDAFAPITRAVVGLTFIALIGWVSIRGRQSPDWPVERQVWWILAGLIVLAPAVFPWYAVMLVPLLPLLANHRPLLISGVLLTVLLPLSYITLPAFHESGIWRNVPDWVRWVEYGIPAVALLTLMGLSRLRS